MIYDDSKEHELFLGCDCWCLNHIAHLTYFPITPEDKKAGEEDTIYFTVKTENYYNMIIPPLRYFYCWYDWRTFFRFHFFNRIGIAFRYIFNPIYTREWGVLDCFDFKNKDLPALDVFLSQIKSDIIFSERKPSYCIVNERWRIVFDIRQHDENFPWELGWSIQFKRRKLLRRIWFAFKYITGQHSDEQEFDLTKREISILRGMILWTTEKNKEKEEKSKEKENDS